MKNTKIFLCVLLSLVLAAGVLLPAVAANRKAPAAAPASASTEITDVFSAVNFSDAAVNDFLKLFPGFCGALMAAFNNGESQSVPVENSSSSNYTIQSTLNTYYNGEQNTKTFSDFFASFNLAVFPRALGTFLINNGYAAAGNAMKNADTWDELAVEGSFSFRWGLDDVADLTERYNAFIAVIGTLIEAARPMFNAVFGNTDLSISFADGNTCCRVRVDDIKLTTNNSSFSLPQNLGDIITKDESGTFSVSRLNLYQSFVIPVYRALGLGSVVPFNFSGYATTTSVFSAHSLYRPLYELVCAVQSDPEKCSELIAFYAGDSGAQLRNAVCNDVNETLTVESQLLDFDYDYTNPNGVMQWDWVADRFGEWIKDVMRFSSTVSVSAIVDPYQIKYELGTLLPALTHTETEEPTGPVDPSEPESSSQPETPSEPESSSQPENPSVPESDTQPENPTDPAGESDNGNPFSHFLEIIRNFIRKLLQWIKDLFAGH